MSSVVILLSTSFHTDVEAREHTSLTVSPLYRVDLRSAIKGQFLFMPMGPGTKEPRSGIPIRSLCFLDNERLAVTVVTRASGRPELQNRREPGTSGSAFQLDGVLIDAASGEVIGMPVWPSNSKYAGIVAANDQGFVIQRGDALELLSAQSKPLKRISLSPLPTDEYAHDSFWKPVSSWSGKHLLMIGWSKASSTWLWVDAESLEVLKSWQDVGAGPVVASDDRLIMSSSSRHFNDSPLSLEIAVPGGNWTPIPFTVWAMYPTFLGPNLLYFHRYRMMGVREQQGAFLLRTDTGQISRIDDPPQKGWRPSSAAASRVGKRFVIEIGETKGSYAALDIGGHEMLRGLIIYDSPFELPAYTLVVQHSKIRNPDTVALSPDGRHLAVLSYPESILEVFELPAVK